MNITDRDIPIGMIRDSMEDIPSFALPAPYSIRWYEPGDEAYWLDIQRKADQFNPITPDLFARQFGTDQKLLAQRMAFLIDGQGLAIGTATAWSDQVNLGATYGQVHWVAIVPDLQGRGLSKPLMTVICNRLKALGHKRAFLKTSTARGPAINLYLKFGFYPDITNPEALEIWHELAPHLAQEVDLDRFGEF